MKYLKRLYIKNFQSHKDTVIEFSPRLNILVGESDQGKTAVIRALRWLFYNKPPKGDFIRTGEDYCEVTAELSDGTRVSRIKKGKRINRYEIIYADGSSYVEEKVGNQVPEAVQEILGNGRLYIDSDKYLDINISYQLEAPFLLAETDGDKAKIIGLIADLDIIDAANRRLLQDMSQASSRKRDVEEEIEKLHEELKAYEDLESKKNILKKGLDMLAEVEEKQYLVEVLQEMEDKWIYLTREMAALDNKLKDMKVIDLLEKHYGIISAKQENLRSLEEIEERFAGTVEQLNLCLKKLKSLEVLEELTHHREQIEKTFSIMKSISELEKKQHEIRENMPKINLILQQTADLAEAENLITCLREKRDLGFELQKLKKEINDREKKLKDVKDALLKTQGLEKGEEIKNLLDLKLKKYDLLKEIQKAYEKNKIDYKQNLEKLKNIEENYSHLLNEYIRVLQEAGKCPVCNTEISTSTIEHIVKSLNLG